MNKGAGEKDATVFRKYKPYPTYKASGVEWLGEAPEHWGIQRLRHTVSGCQNGTWGEEPIGDTGDMICIRVADFDRIKNKIAVLSEPTLRYIPQQQQEKFILNSGELLIEKSGGGDQQPVGVVMLYDLRDRAVCSNFIARMRVKSNNNSIFLLYLHKHLYESGINRRSIKQNTGIQNLDLKSYLSEYVVMPSITDQYKIADFLDRETVKIDALIAKQEQLIELLQEKRAALITHAVTKGLDPNVPMKDSGVEWLGEIPAYWGIVPLKRLGEFQGGAGFPDNLQGRIDGELPFYKVSDTNNIGNEMYMKYHNNTISKETASYLRAFIFPKGTIVFPKVGAALLLNKRRILTRPSCIDNNMMGFIPCTGDLRWLYYWMCGLDLGRLANPGAVPSINESQLRDIVVPLPPEEEQRIIGLYLANSNSVLNKTVDKISKAVSLLREYRTALISAAVTGKIDVREEVSSA